MPTDRSKISSKSGYFSPLAYTPFNFSRTLPLINRNILFKIGDCCTSKMFFLHDQLYFDYFYSDKKSLIFVFLSQNVFIESVFKFSQTAELNPYKSH